MQTWIPITLVVLIGILLLPELIKGFMPVSSIPVSIRQILFGIAYVILTFRPFHYQNISHRENLYGGSMTESSLVKCLYLTNYYEPNIVALFEEILKPGDVCIDIGANEGFFTVIASRLVGDSGKVYAIEPSSRNCKLLRNNLRLNDIINVHIHEIAHIHRIST